MRVFTVVKHKIHGCNKRTAIVGACMEISNSKGTKT